MTETIDKMGDEWLNTRILLFRGKGIISATIRWQTRSPYSHVGILTPWGTVIEAWHIGGVREKRLVDWTNVNAYRIPSATANELQEAVLFARGQVGKPYDFLSIVRFISRRGGHDYSRASKWFCSELVHCAFAKAGLPLLSERMGAGTFSPRDIAMSPLIEYDSVVTKLNQTKKQP